MRIIAGIARGLTLAAPRGGDVRPTSDRTRAAIFSSLGARVTGATVLDLFAGTGGLGLEAASRGAAAVTFVECARPVLDCLERNVAMALTYPDVTRQLTIVRAEVAAQLRQWAVTGGQFALVLADPPYGAAAQALLDDQHLPRLITADGGLVLESAKRDELVVPPAWELTRAAVYGDTRVSFLAARNRVQFKPLGSADGPLTWILSPADGGEESSPLPLAGEGQGEGGCPKLHPGNPPA
jgi:16S rRNA (guanine966-N2)-methyltransferase